MRKHLCLDAVTPSAGALDFSDLLDAPAGKHGQTVVRDGHLYFQDGTRARFIGFNFTSPTVFARHETAERFAARLASLGCNVVRLHAEDCLPRGRDQLSLIDYSETGRGRRLNPVALERIHYLIAQLKARGIYVQVDLHCYRAFTNIGDLKATPPYAPAKALTIFDQELIDLQKEFAKQYLSAVNPYTGLSLLEDPAVMCIQITNENSALWVNLQELEHRDRAPYEQQRQRLFNEFLLKKYGSRQGLEAAWTREGECALLPQEDPAQGTVAPIEYGDYMQPYRDMRRCWTTPASPARYADYLSFAMEVNESYYRQMIDYVKSLGAKAPVNGTNLLHGIADIYSSTRSADVCENNAYYNHAMGSGPSTNYAGARFTWHETVQTDPRTTTYPVFDVRDGHMIAQLAGAALKDKPYVISEWLDCGATPFHSTSFLMQAAYACLQDWDGLILFCYCHGEEYRDLPCDQVKILMDAYNDPSLIAHLGVMASIFLKGQVRAAQRVIDLCYTMEDTRMLPENYKMPYGFLPFVSGTRTVFLPDGVYRGDGDLAVSGGFSANGDYTGAGHALVYARSPYQDALQHVYVGAPFWDRHRGAGAAPFLRMGTLSDTAAVIDPDKIDGIERHADYTGFSRFVDGAMKRWGLWDPDAGLAGPNRFVSDTHELSFDFGLGQFRVDAPEVQVFSGHPNAPVCLGPVCAEVQNERMTLALLSRDGLPLAQSRRMVLTATGETGNDGNRFVGDICLGFGGKLFADDLQGTLTLAQDGEIHALDIHGNRLYALEKHPDDRGFVFLTGGSDQPALAFEITLYGPDAK